MPLEIAIDSTEAIGMLKMGNHIMTIIYECGLLIQRMGITGVKYSYREQNRVVDLLAKKGAKTNFLGRTTMLQFL